MCSELTYKMEEYNGLLLKIASVYKETNRFKNGIIPYEQAELLEEYCYELISITPESKTENVKKRLIKIRTLSHYNGIFANDDLVEKVIEYAIHCLS